MVYRTECFVFVGVLGKVHVHFSGKCVKHIHHTICNVLCQTVVKLSII